MTHSSKAQSSPNQNHLMRRRYDKEERFFNSHEKKIFSENSLKYEESILWTKGEILGKGAYGTVSETGSLLK